MRVTVIRLAWAFLLLMMACRGTLFSGGKEDPRSGQGQGELQGEETQQKSPPAVLEVQNSQYDGNVLSGRLLVGALGDGLRLDKRLESGADINVDSVTDCATGQFVSFVIADGFRPAPRQEDLLILNNGYWYGTQMHFRLFTKKGPDCIRAEVSLLSYDGQPVARMEVRAERVQQQPADAGVPEEPRHPADAGTP